MNAKNLIKNKDVLTIIPGEAVVATSGGYHTDHRDETYAKATI